MRVLKLVFLFLLKRFKGHDASYILSDRWDTVPNIITYIGILLIPAYVVCFVTRSHTFFIPIISAAIVVTDILDGWIADYLDQHSRIGKCIDPLRDRLYLGAVFLNLFFLSIPNVSIPALIVAGAEGGIVINGFLKYHGNVVEVHWVGKLRMAVHSVCASMLLVQEYWLAHYYVSALFIVWIMVLMSVTALLAYMLGRVKTIASMRVH